jgi:hypothetical protein
MVSGAQEPSPVPKPGPQHDFLKQDVGTWDATVEMFTAPGAKPEVAKGTETVSMVGPFWQVSQFKSQLMGQPFSGLGTLGYDPTEKKFLGTWVDSMTPGLSRVEGTYDPEKKTLTGTMDARDMNGNAAKFRETTEWKDPNTRVFTMYGPKTADGKEPVMMRISYKRRAATTRR